MPGEENPYTILIQVAAILLATLLLEHPVLRRVRQFVAARRWAWISAIILVLLLVALPGNRSHPGEE